jgi:hypothetical protein
MEVNCEQQAKDAVRIVEFLTNYRTTTQLPIEIDLHLSGLNWSILKSIVHYYRIRQTLIDETHNRHKE